MPIRLALDDKLPMSSTRYGYGLSAQHPIVRVPALQCIRQLLLVRGAVIRKKKHYTQDELGMKKCCIFFLLALSFHSSRVVG